MRSMRRAVEGGGEFDLAVFGHETLKNFDLLLLNTALSGHAKSCAGFVRLMWE